MAELTQTVKAVGFSFLSPEVVLLVADKTAYCLHFYPSKADGGRLLDLASSDRPHWVLLKSPEHIGAMAPHSGSIHRLLVFGRPEELTSLGLPILDATVTSSGVEVNRRSNRDELLARIDKEAVDLPLVDMKKPNDLKKQEQDKMTRTPSGKTFFQQLKDLKAIVGKDNPKLNLVTQVGVPAILRIMGDISREQFAAASKLMVTHGGVSEDVARGFYRWIEGYDGGEGVELGKAVDALLYPKQGATDKVRPEDDWTDELTAKLATQFGVSEDDLLFVARSYVKLLEEKAKTAVTPAPAEDDGGFPTGGVSDADEPVPEEGEPEPEEQDEEPEAKYPGEEGFSSDDSAFGWPDEGGDDKGDDESDGMHETTGDDDADGESSDSDSGGEQQSFFGGSDFSDF